MPRRFQPAEFMKIAESAFGGLVTELEFDCTEFPCFAAARKRLSKEEWATVRQSFESYYEGDEILALRQVHVSQGERSRVYVLSAYPQGSVDEESLQRRSFDHLVSTIELVDQEDEESAEAAGVLEEAYRRALREGSAVAHQ